MFRRHPGSSFVRPQNAQQLAHHGPDSVVHSYLVLAFQVEILSLRNHQTAVAEYDNFPVLVVVVVEEVAAGTSVAIAVADVVALQVETEVKVSEHAVLEEVEHIVVADAVVVEESKLAAVALYIRVSTSSSHICSIEMLMSESELTSETYEEVADMRHDVVRSSVVHYTAAARIVVVHSAVAAEEVVDNSCPDEETQSVAAEEDNVVGAGREESLLEEVRIVAGLRNVNARFFVPTNIMLERTLILPRRCYDLSATTSILEVVAHIRG
jgi:hypothetical protein